MTFQRSGKGHFLLNIEKLDVALIRDWKIKIERDL